MPPNDTLLEMFDFYRLDAIDRSRGLREFRGSRTDFGCSRAHVSRLSKIERCLSRLHILCKTWRFYRKHPGCPADSDLQVVSGCAIRRASEIYVTPPQQNVIIGRHHPDRVCLRVGVSTNSTTRIGPFAEIAQEAVQFLALKRIQLRVNVR
jgi:hypothetical protein